MPFSCCSVVKAMDLHPGPVFLVKSSMKYHTSGQNCTHTPENALAQKSSQTEKCRRLNALAFFDLTYEKLLLIYCVIIIIIMCEFIRHTMSTCRLGGKVKS